MTFLKSDTLKSLEGKILKFESGVTRRLQLIDHKIKDSPNGIRHEITVRDAETGDEKTFFAPKGFMRKLEEFNHLLDVGTIIRVTPTEETFTLKDGPDAGKEIKYFKFDDFSVEQMNKF